MTAPPQFHLLTPSLLAARRFQAARISSMDFAQWLITQGVSSATSAKYDRAIYGRVSELALKLKLTHLPFSQQSDPDGVLRVLFLMGATTEFREFNRKGHQMYSAAINHFENFTKFLKDQSVQAEIERIENLADVPETTKTSLVASRLGQGRFRSNLIALWGSCSVTGYPGTTMLLASHIKPWSSSTNHERLDANNGLLLTPNLDRAFDLGLLTFNSDGVIQLSAHLREPKLLGIDPSMRLREMKMTAGYLDYHRSTVFSSD